MSETIALTKQLISAPSVTPEDAGCQQLMASRLSELGFNCQFLRFEEVDNLWATIGKTGPLFCFAGHTDVVPTGPLDDWQSPPFEPTEKEGYLFGRGAADMKTSLAAMITACERFVREHGIPELFRIGFLITSDEEGPAKNGTVKVMEWLEGKDKIDYCLVGEPSSTDRLGDIIKNGRRGSLNCQLTIKGIQGHIAYPHLAKNPIHLAAPFIAELTQVEWDKGNDFFPATSFQISNIRSGTGVTNVIPGDLELTFNFRYSTEVTHEILQDRVEALIKRHQLKTEIKWQLSGKPFLTKPGKLVNACQHAITKVTGHKAKLSTTGGTSDGRFIAPYGVQVVELGPINATIHKVNECIDLNDIEPLSDIYFNLLTEFL